MADAVTGELVHGARAHTPAVPASTIKIATAVAALTALGPDHRLTTEVVTGSGEGEIVLVGGGDPTLTARGSRQPGSPASLRDLADRTARALKEDGTGKAVLAYDTSRWSGPDRHPIGLNDNIAPVVPLSTDAGRLDDSHRARRPAPPTPRPTPRRPSRTSSATAASRSRGSPAAPRPERTPSGSPPSAPCPSPPSSNGP